MSKLAKEMMIIALAVIAGIYLINPTAGIIELLPDNLPIVGNLDEAAAVAILLAALRYYGIDITRLFKRDGDGEVVEGQVYDQTYNQQ